MRAFRFRWRRGASKLLCSREGFEGFGDARYAPPNRGRGYVTESLPLCEPRASGLRWFEVSPVPRARPSRSSLYVDKEGDTMKPSDPSAYTILNRAQVTELILVAKIKKKLKWRDVAEQVGKSKEWVTAACLGQMTLTKEQAEVV